MIGRYSDEMTFDYIMNRMLESVPDTVDKREGSIIYDALSPAAAELVKCYMELDVVMDETFVDTASLQYLALRCKERGVAIQGETAAVIEGVFTPSSVELTAGLRFNCDEVNYTITEKISAGHYKLEAETLGTVGNKYTGLLLPIQTVNGLETAQIAAVLIPAEDGDTTDTLREKYYASIDGEAFGGNVADYREKVNAITGVGGVKVYPVWNGGGTVKLTIIASDFTAPSTELISKVQTAIDPEGNQGEGLGLAPVGGEDHHGKALFLVLGQVLHQVGVRRVAAPGQQGAEIEKHGLVVGVEELVELCLAQGLAGRGHGQTLPFEFLRLV